MHKFATFHNPVLTTTKYNFFGKQLSGKISRSFIFKKLWSKACKSQVLWANVFYYVNNEVIKLMWNKLHCLFLLWSWVDITELICILRLLNLAWTREIELGLNNSRFQQLCRSVSKAARLASQTSWFWNLLKPTKGIFHLPYCDVQYTMIQWSCKVTPLSS